MIDKGALPGPSVQTAGAIIGHSGWLFLTGDSNDTLAQTQGLMNLSPPDLEAWVRLLECRTAWLEQRGIAYYVIVVPNKESLYAEHLPDGITLSEDRPIRRLEHRLLDHPTIRFRYLLDDLVPWKRDWELYPTTDSHWNEIGAFFGYRSAMTMIRQDFGADASYPDIADLEVREHPGHVGDLGSKLQVPVVGSYVTARLKRPRAEVIYDNHREAQDRRDTDIRNRGSLRVTACELEDGSAGLRAVVLHDSFYYAMSPFFRESFPWLCSAHTKSLDFEIIERERPDLVLTEMVERFVVRRADDYATPPVSVTYRQKLEELYR